MTTQMTLQELARKVRGTTLEILTGTGSEGLTFAPPGTFNHILWHSGHALWLQDVLCIQLLTGHSELPAGWSESFGMKCRPVVETRQWPDRQELVRLLQEQLVRIEELLDQATTEQLNRPADVQRGPASVTSRIIHGLHDEARHSGEMYLLYKLTADRD